jgi:superfamily II DNA or RNA helicase
MKFRPFAEARDYVHKLGLKSQEEWTKYCKSGKKPIDIPSNPNKAYKNEWTSLGDWLGTGAVANQNRRYRPFAEARDFVHTLRLKDDSQWREYRKSGKKPPDIPSNPNTVYKKEWKGTGDWLGTGRVADRYKEFRPFAEARDYVHKLGLKSQEEWKKYCDSGQKPPDIPSAPNAVYENEWTSWGDWLGTGRIADQYREFRPFKEAREFVRSLRLRNADEWRQYCKSGEKPVDIPQSPHKTYKNEWKSWPDWLGTGTIPNRDLHKYVRPFAEAKQFVHTLNLKNREEWKKYCDSGQKPPDIPSAPVRVYKNEWKGMGDWLGTDFIAPKYRQYRPFKEARAFVRSLKLKGNAEWENYAKSGHKPLDIPYSPEKTYGDEWTSWGDWLGTGTIQTQKRQYRTFEEAKEFVSPLNLTDHVEWIKYCKSGQKPEDIPSNPPGVYEKEWRGWPDWLGYEARRWTLNEIKDLLRDLIASKIIYQWNEAVLYSFLIRKGVLSLYSTNRHSQFFKNFIEASRTDEGRKAIERYANSDSEIPPELSKFTPSYQGAAAEDVQQEIQTASSEELSQLIEDKDPLDYGETQTVEQILSHTNILESINVDEEAMRFYLDYSLDELWKTAFRQEIDTVVRVRQEGNNGNKYHDAVVDTFLSDYNGTKNTEIPKGYAFPYEPTLMQKYVAYKVNTNPYFGNFSGTGAGKTLSAVLASRAIDSKMTAIVCPNDVVDQWRKSILEIFPDSKVITGKEAFYANYDENEHKYLVLNYDKFSQEDSPNLILNLIKQKIDFIVLDEIHFVKKRDEDASQRRRNLDGLMTAVRKKNSEVRVLGLSATPVVNNLMEGRSLLELITGKIYDDVAISPTISNAVTLYEKLSTISIRELPKYAVDVHTEHIDVQAEKPQQTSIRYLKSNPLAIEQFLTDARIPEIIKLIESQTIIYTEYVTDVIRKLSDALRDAGYSFAFYTGSDRTGFKRFLDRDVQVLIASRPISVGVDGLQHICNRLIINTLPWTNAQYQQLLGRLIRKGQIRDVVHVYIVKASISGYSYDQWKWDRIQFKRTLADCAVDGRLPEKNLVTPQQAALEAVKWLERLERGEISSVVRRDLNVELTPVQIEQRIRKYGDFTRLNQQINSENSETTHERLLKDPQAWEEYHRQYREARKTWHYTPYEEIIKRINELSPMLQVGDFGCGEAKIMEAFGPGRVHSFDHIAINDKVISCDMKKVPLPDDALDMVVFSLSLMGKNWREYIKEAKRCLATNGYLLIAETNKSLNENGRLSTLRDILKGKGFEIYQDEERGEFTFIEAREL